MIIVSRTQFHVERPWGQRLFSIAGGAGGKERAAVKQRMKATQKKYLSAAHDQIWGMLDQFKQRGEVIITPSF